MRVLLMLVVASSLAACGPSNRTIREENLAADAQAQQLRGVSQRGPDRCDADPQTHEVSTYDTSGDEWPDVRKVFLRIGDPPLVRLVLVCREADLNADGTKDVVRYYTDEGRPLREEADRNFDGQMDEILFFEEGRIVRMEQDTSGNGQVDTKIFYEEGRPLRAERDLAARSTPTNWQPDRWEYYENGRMVRMGTDLDGDGRVDRWDRDEIYREQQEARQRAEEARRQAEEDAANQAADDAVDNEG